MEAETYIYVEGDSFFLGGEAGGMCRKSLVLTVVKLCTSMSVNMCVYT